MSLLVCAPQQKRFQLYVNLTQGRAVASSPEYDKQGEIGTHVGIGTLESPGD